MLNLQANTPVMGVSARDSDGFLTVSTERGVVRTKAVIHTTNRWASHLLPEFEKLILPVKGTVAAIKTPEGFIKHTGAQHWDSVVNVGCRTRAKNVASRLTFNTELSLATAIPVQHDYLGRGATIPRTSTRRDTVS